VTEGETYSVDHIDQNPKNNHLSNLRWATTSEQRANRTYPDTYTLRAINVTKDGVTTTHANTKAVLRFLELPVTHSKEVAFTKAMREGKSWKGATMAPWAPSRLDTGEWRMVPPAFIGGVSGMMASERGGWIRRVDGGYTQGTFHKRVDKFVVSFKRKQYYVHRLTCAAWHGMPPSANHQANHKRGSPHLSADAGDLEWLTAQENARHAVTTDLITIKRPVLMLHKDTGEEVHRFDSLVEAVSHVRLHIRATAVQAPIWNACRGNLQTSYGYMWRYDEETRVSKRARA